MLKRKPPENCGVYVAASSMEIERAEKWIQALRDEEITVTSTWPENIRRVQAERAMKSVFHAANPPEATKQDRFKWSMENVGAIYKATNLWLLIPDSSTPSQGAYFEFGVAYGRKNIFVSGGDQRFIFTALADTICDTDEQAFEYIRRSFMSADEAVENGWRFSHKDRFWPDIPPWIK